MVVLPLREEGSVCPAGTPQRRVLPRLRSLLQRAKGKGAKTTGTVWQWGIPLVQVGPVDGPPRVLPDPNPLPRLRWRNR